MNVWIERFQSLPLRRQIEWTAATALTLVLLVTFLVPGGGSDRYDEEPLPDFAAIDDVQEMKAAFFDYLTPIIEHENSRIMEQRSELQAMLAEVAGGGDLGNRQRQRLDELAASYEMEVDPQDTELSLRQLLLRADKIPLSLALVQAAKESGWGRSRFAREANNLFGQWCYSRGCGLVPSQRPDGEIYEVQDFDTVGEAIGAYLHNLNTHPPYRAMRLMRAGMRAAGEALDGEVLAEGLLQYSQRREAYVEEVQSMVRQYRSFQSDREEQG